MKELDIKDNIQLFFRRNMVAHCCMWKGKGKKGSYFG